MHEVQRHTLALARVESPVTVAQALEILASAGSRARVVAGGTDLLLELERGVRPDVDVLVDITRIPGLDAIESTDGHVRLGPLTTHNDVVRSDVIRDHAIPLAQACWEIGSPQLRNRATVVGNLVTASPANDTITPLRVLDAELELTSSAGTRTVSLSAFHPGMRRTALAPGEIVTAVTMRPLRSGERAVFLKLGNRTAQAISVVHLTASVELADDGTVTAARLALGSVAPTIVEVDLSELVGTRLEDDAVTSAAMTAAEAVQPIDDVRATAEYRSGAIPVMVTRALRALREGTPPSLPAAPVTLGQVRPAAAPSAMVHDAETRVEAVVNGRETAARGGTLTLLDWLRDRAGLTGAKEGCAEGECGACTVVLDGAAVMSCLVPAARAHGARITTIEGLGVDGALHPLQQAFIDRTAVQCGFCIPGFLMAGASLLDERPAPTRGEIEIGLSGNLCRCTGYYPIIAAVETAAGGRR